MARFNSWENRIYESENINNSTYVVESADIKDSSHIFYSTNIFNSRDVVECDDVVNSKQIFFSSMIEECEKIVKSTNISNSKNICESSMVSESTDVFKSSNVFASSQIERSKDLTDVYFSSQVEGLSHCLFCFGAKGSSYLLFNKPVDQARFELVKKQCKKYFTDYLCFATGWYRELSSASVPRIHYNFNSHYSNLSDKFWKWVESLPNFDKQILYNITINARFL